MAVGPCVRGKPVLPAIVLLLVEDETLLHGIIEEGLSDSGFELVIKGNGQDAIAELDANAARFRAVITDIRLGEGPSGWDVGRHARHLVPDMPVIYLSGDSAIDWAAEGVPESIMVKKPFVLAQLVTAITTLMNKDTL
jgi:DNA-binding response OmpR family regulator